MVGTAALLLGLYLSVFFVPYPLFRHHAELAGFSVYSDREIPEGFGQVFADARHRVDQMELYHGAPPPRIFICRSRRLFVFLVRLAGKRHAGQGLLISAAGNAFLSADGIESVARRNRERPAHSRLEGSWSAAVAHEVAHHLMFSELGLTRARATPVWKSEGYADYAANAAAAGPQTDSNLRSRVRLLLDEERWRGFSGSVDRRHFRWHVLVDYLCTIQDLDFHDLMDEAVTESEAWYWLMEWYDQSPSSPAPE